MKLYHGSYLEIERIDLSKSMKGKDFGKGFYLSSDLKQAQSIAEIRSISLRVAPVVNIYEFDEAVLYDGSLKVKRFDGYSADWAKFVLLNRNNYKDKQAHEFDVVIGPIANDRVGQQIRKYIDGEISMEEFIDRLKYMKGITFQYFFSTERAIKYLVKESSLHL